MGPRKSADGIMLLCPSRRQSRQRLGGNEASRLCPRRRLEAVLGSTLMRATRAGRRLPWGPKAPADYDWRDACLPAELLSLMRLALTHGPCMPQPLTSRNGHVAFCRRETALSNWTSKIHCPGFRTPIDSAARCARGARGLNMALVFRFPLLWKTSPSLGRKRTYVRP